jgi:hypothetical protein
MASPTLETKTMALLEVLEADIRHVENVLSRLDTLRTLLIRREDAALEQLLGEVRQESDVYRGNEQKRQQLRRDLAAELGCTERELTLSKLQSHLTGWTRDAVADRQARLRALTGQLKRQYTLTVLLLRDCTRFNRSLLRAFFGSSGRGGTTYSATGTEKRSTPEALMNAKL